MITYPFLCSGRSCTNSCLHWLTSTSTLFLSFTSSAKYLAWQMIKRIHIQAPCEESKTCFTCSNPTSASRILGSLPLNESRYWSFRSFMLITANVQWMFICIGINICQQQKCSLRKYNDRIKITQKKRSYHLVTIYEMVAQLLHWSPSSDCTIVVSSPRMN